jgi:hypothetical protein
MVFVSKALTFYAESHQVSSGEQGATGSRNSIDEYTTFAAGIRSVLTNHFTAVLNP